MPMSKVEGGAIVVLADDSVKDTVTDQLMDVTTKMNAEDENVPGYQPARNIFFTPFRMGDEFCAEVIRKNNKGKRRIATTLIFPSSRSTRTDPYLYHRPILSYDRTRFAILFFYFILLIFVLTDANEATYSIEFGSNFSL